MKAIIKMDDMKAVTRFIEFNKLYAKHFTADPAQRCVEVFALSKSISVEIKAVAEIC